MNWKTLCDILRTAATSGKKLDAFVTFTEDSFDKPYTKRERTYLLSSDNKAFRPAGGYSIFGSCLDGTDVGVRLESYMKEEKGGKDGWKVENCGLVKYQLTSVYERELCVVGYFNTQKEANRAMWEALAQAVECEPDELHEYIEANAEECEFAETSAWLNKRGNSDWNIIPIYIDGQNIVTFNEA